MATARGRCVRDQTSARFGDCATAVDAAPSDTCGVVWVWAVVLVVVEDGGGGDGASWNWRAVVLNVAAVRFGSCRAAVAATPRRRETYIVSGCCGSRGVVVVVVVRDGPPGSVN